MPQIHNERNIKIVCKDKIHKQSQAMVELDTEEKISNSTDPVFV